MAALGRLVVTLSLLLIGGLWLYSHHSPQSFGVCHQVPLNIGQEATVRDCQAYGTTDFVVPLVVVALGAFLLGTGEAELSIPGFGTFKRKRQARQAADVLKQEQPSIEQRTEKFLETLSTSDRPSNYSSRRPSQ